MFSLDRVNFVLNYLREEFRHRGLVPAGETDDLLQHVVRLPGRLQRLQIHIGLCSRVKSQKVKLGRHAGNISIQRVSRFRIFLRDRSGRERKRHRKRDNQCQQSLHHQTTS